MHNGNKKLGEGMDYQKALNKLEACGQEHLLKYWSELAPERQKRLLEQIEALDVAHFHQQQILLQTPVNKEMHSLEAFKEYAQSGNKSHFELGERLLREGQMGCLLIAGGQGTRLKFKGPKGMYPITPVEHKSLFQFFAEKVVAAGKQVQRLLPLAIMTSPINHLETWNFFVANHFFGLEPEQVSFFSQAMSPFLDQQGNLFLEEKDLIAEGPDGNGASLEHFVESGIWAKWHSQGVEYVNYVLIDNPLADPFDAELLGFHCEQQADVTVKCTSRRDVDEKVGLLVISDQTVHVIEYSEMPSHERIALNNDGNLKHICANLSLFCFNMDFINKVNKRKRKIPLHCALKAAKSVGKEIMAWKCEKFIFDVLPFAHKIKALLYPRERCFAPLKNASGKDSPEEVKAALQREAQRIWQEVTGQSANAPEELPAEFYYPTPQLLDKYEISRFSQRKGTAGGGKTQR